MYYHILVKFTVLEQRLFGKKEKEFKEIIVKNLNELKINNYFIIPYFKGEDIYKDGFILNKKTVRSFCIRKSEENFEKIIESLEEKIISLPDSYEFISDEEAFTSMEEVTNEMIMKFKENINQKTEDLDTKNNKNIFVVHGRDELSLNQIQLFLRERGLNPVVLGESENEGLTIIEKFEKCSRCRFAIVLYTPCDLGGLAGSSSDLQYRARQNVVFEHGYLMSKLGRDCVVTLVKKGVDLPSDLSGLLYISMENKHAWQNSLKKEMLKHGYKM